ncbi:MarR family winged helix-turn-helix transcriptional regulator [Frondihabitans cladoniiphilus]|uniref:HTH marR-type domain-containing protein n=1 Tax=Frondihabitans cladoniiphilus TaxID=715785 RepID=A0ABP8WC59_9MICO
MSGAGSSGSGASPAGSSPAGGELGIADTAPVSFAIFDLARSHRAVADGLLTPLGMHASQEILLMRLFGTEGLSQKDLAAAVRLDASTVARSVQRLETLGYVTRAPSPDDGRVQLVALTEAGRGVHSRTRDAWAALEERTTQSLSADEAAAFRALAAKVVAGLGAGLGPGGIPVV